MPPRTHIRFGDDDEDVDEPTAPPPAAGTSSGDLPAAQPQNIPPGTACARLSVLTAVRTDFETRSECYVFDIAQSGAVLAASLSNHKVKLYAAADAHLTPGGELAGHAGGITEIGFFLPSAPQVLHSCSRDGTVRGWDTRTRAEGERIEARGKQLFSLTVHEHVIAAGADSEVLFWDRRTGKPMGSFQDAHAEEVTQVKFHPTQPNVFLSASTDGLISIYDMSNGLDEDDGFMACLNTGNSNAQVGFYGPAGERLWCRTHTEGLHLWDWRAACSEEGLDGGGALLCMENFREAASAAAAAAGLAELEDKVDYIVGCTYEPGSNGLWVNAGSNEGPAAIFPVLQDSTGAHGLGAPCAVLSGGHNSVVRCLLWPGVGTRCLTAGEDARMCVWDLPQTAAAGGGTAAVAPDRRPHRHADRRHSPY